MIRRALTALALLVGFERKRKPHPTNGCPAAYAVRGANYHLVHCVLEKGHEPPCEDADGNWRADLK